MMKYNLIFYVIASPYGIDWSSPQKLSRDNIRNHLFSSKDRKISHVSVELSALDTDGGKVFERILTGMAGINMKSYKQVFFQQVGLGTLFCNYQGKLENTEDLDLEFEQKAKEGRLSLMKFSISESVYQRLQQYLNEYRLRGYYKNYGLPNRPRYGEGGGCSAFAMSFLEIAGLMRDTFKKSWSYNLKVPLRLLGGPLSTDRKVSIWDILGAKSWAQTDEDFREIFFWHPDDIDSWIKKDHKLESLSSELGFQVKRGMWKGKCPILEFKAEHCEAPKGPIWQI